MLLRLPKSLHYPITITKVEKRVGEFVTEAEGLFLYNYKTIRKEQKSRYDEEEVEVERNLTTHFPSTLEGKIMGWRIWEGDIITEPQDVCEVEEECSHQVQYLGLCTNCGQDMTRIKPSSGTSNVERAPVRMAHDTPHLTISQDEATKIDEDAKKRLLAARKLSLVVDLDQTIIHAAVDPTIGEWQKDKDNPNYDAVKDVRAFQLLDDGPGMRGCWYYIKLRPGLAEFLEHVSQIYELHVYTMGTRQYAQQIANIVDPEHKFFSDRILSRDESGSMVAKNLERLFPVDTKMVVIIDDRADVWKWSANLIRVTPFDFFVGIGDINSSFLPKKEEIQTTTKPLLAADESENTQEAEQPKENGDKVNGVAEDGTSTVQEGTAALETLIAMSGSDDPAAREVQNRSQEDTIASQLEDKPLLKMQQQQDEKDQKVAADDSSEQIETNGDGPASQTTESESDSSESSSSSLPSKPKPRHSILKNDDEELLHLETSLTSLHTSFFREWDRKRLSGKGGRVAALAGKKKAQIEDESTPADLMLIPDVKQVLPAMKVKVLKGVVIVFSGVLPLGSDIQNADISTWAKTYGASVVEKVTRDVTHVIAARPGTAKVKQAIKKGIKVVGTPWLIESMQRWRKLDEKPYLLEGAGKQKMEDPSENGDEPANIDARDFLLSSSEESTGFESDAEGPARKKLKRDTAGAENSAENLDDFIEDHSLFEMSKSQKEDIDAELAEFMDGVESESDAESVSSSLSHRDKPAPKRRRREDDDGEDERDASLKVPKSSRLKAVANVDTDSGASTPVPTDTEIAEDQRRAEQGQAMRDSDEEASDDEMARALQDELDKADEQSDEEGL